MLSNNQVISKPIMDYDFNDPKLIDLLKKFTFRNFESNQYKDTYDQFNKIFLELSSYLKLIMNNIINLPNMSQNDQMKFFHFYTVVNSCITSEISNIIRNDINEAMNLRYMYDTSNKSVINKEKIKKGLDDIDDDESDEDNDPEDFTLN